MMKNKPLLLVVLFLCLNSCVTVNFIDTQSYVSVKDNVEVGYTEVSVRHWMTYVINSSIPIQDSVIYLNEWRTQINSKLPDLEQASWGNYVIKAMLRADKKLVVQHVDDLCNNSYQSIYMPKIAWDSIKKFKLLDIPIVGITYEQALDYLAYVQRQDNECVPSPKKSKQTYRYEYFLPTPEQFDSLQSHSDSINSKGCNRFNYKNSLCIDCPYGQKNMKHPVASKTGKEPTYVWSYFPNELNLFNLKGNVAEMTSVKGIAKGGSCAHYANEASAAHSQFYSNPEPWLGLRIWSRKYEK